MLLSAGEHEIGPWNGHLILRTFREGVAARAGHDLVIEATRWQGTITIPDAPDSDRREINKTSAKLLRTGEHPQALFVSTTVRVDGDKATVDGELTLLEVTHPLRLTAQATDDRTVIASASVQQSLWGIRPYRGFMGALKVRDTVEVEATVTLA